MKITLILSLCAVLLAGCNTRSKELEKQNAELQAKSNELYKELSTRDEYIGQVMDAVNGMHENLEGAREKEKLLLSETDKMEGANKASSGEIRQKMLGQIAEIDSSLKSDRKKLAELQAKVRSYRTQFASLNKMIEGLKKTLEERETSIAALQTRVAELEGEVSQKTMMVAQRDSTINEQQTVISRQTSKINTGYYIVGTRRELKEKGIIADEGGLLWGLFGTTTILANGFDSKLFTPINKTTEMKIEVKGAINEIVPKRNLQFYSTAASADRERSTLTILKSEQFWQDNFLVIITN
jgi:peptidoglycan hydrolase CwlO-like protein